MPLCSVVGLRLQGRASDEDDRERAPSRRSRVLRGCDRLSELALRGFLLTYLGAAIITAVAPVVPIVTEDPASPHTHPLIALYFVVTAATMVVSTPLRVGYLLVLGHRRWQLGKWCNPSTTFKPNQPIRIFDDMGDIIFDEELAPGDILYVPSRLSHYGVAQDDCLTFSFGLRYPNAVDLLEYIVKGMEHEYPDIDLSTFNIPLRLSPARQKTGKLDPTMVQNMKRQLLEQLVESEPFDRLFQKAVSMAVTSRRYELLVGDETADPDEVRSLLEEGFLLEQDNNCKLLYTETPLEIYANGEWLDELNPLEKAVLKRLADGERLGFNEFKDIARHVDKGNELILLLPDSICNWLDDGWVLLDES